VVGIRKAAIISTPTSGQIPSTTDRMATYSQTPMGQPAT
jgi:hypothetical protein